MAAAEGNSAETVVSEAEEEELPATDEQGKSQDGSDYSIPSHLMGRTVENPAADIPGEVRAYQKPRLGVRVPYLNLTSQIVSQDEIAAELLERAQKKQTVAIDGSKAGDVFFTMKMTHRLVKSIKPVFPESGANQQSGDEADSGVQVTTPITKMANNPSGTSSEEQATLQNELLETLKDDSPTTEIEEVSPVVEKKVTKQKVERKFKPKVHVKLDRELEKQLALQQLQEFNVQKVLRKELKNKMKTELKEKSKIEAKEKPKKRSRKLGKLKNIVINRKLDETEAPILPYKSIARKHKVTIGVVPVNGAETTPKITANVNEVTEAPPEVPELKMEKDNRYMKKYSNKRFKTLGLGSEDVTNGSNEIIDEIASEILDPTPKKKAKKSKAAANGPQTPASDGKRKSRRKPVPSAKLKEAEETVSAKKTPSPKVEEAEEMVLENDVSISNNNEAEMVDGQTEAVETIEGQYVPVDISQYPEAKKSRMMREIDRLLMDEGAINMLYSIEEKRSPKNNKQKPNLLPSTRRKKKDLLLKTKLVKTAVLKLSGSPKDNSNRVQRQNKLEEVDPALAGSASVEDSVPCASPKASSSSLPAEASRIIRRHSSSSSFSSTAGSPRRMSTDFTEHPIPNLNPDIENSGRKQKKKALANKSKRGASPKKDPLTIHSSEPSSTSTPKVKEPTSNILSAGKVSAPVANDIRAAMSKNFNKKVSSPRTVIKKTLYAEERNAAALNAELAMAATSMSSMPPPPEQTTPAASSKSAPAAVSSEATPKTSSSQENVNASQSTNKTGSLFLDSIVNKEFAEKLERLDKMQARLPPANPGAKADSYCEISVKKVDRIMHVVLTPTSTKVKNALNIRALREIASALQQATSDKSIRVVLMTSTGTSFCQGIDFETVIEDDAEKRKNIVVELAMAVRDFIHGLGMFNKLLVAGVHGPAVGLGVMMLPYFDMVFASDRATFYTPYTKLGQVPEGAPALTLHNLLSNAATSELIYGCRQLTASEALRCGLVTRILWPDRFQEELTPIVAEISTHSAQAMEATKTLMRRDLRGQLNMALAAECHLLVKNWSTAECQENFKKFIDDESFWQITKQ